MIGNKRPLCIVSGHNTTANTHFGLYLKMVAEQTNWIMSGHNTTVNTLFGLYLKMVAGPTNWIMSGDNTTANPLLGLYLKMVAGQTGVCLEITPRQTLSLDYI